MPPEGEKIKKTDNDKKILATWDELQELSQNQEKERIQSYPGHIAAAGNPQLHKLITDTSSGFELYSDNDLVRISEADVSNGDASRLLLIS